MHADGAGSGDEEAFLKLSNRGALTCVDAAIAAFTELELVMSAWQRQRSCSALTGWTPFVGHGGRLHDLAGPGVPDLLKSVVVLAHPIPLRPDPQHRAEAVGIVDRY